MQSSSVIVYTWHVLRFVGIECPDPGTPSNGRRIGDDFRGGMFVFFVCDDGYMIRGEPLLRCLDNRTWSQDTPTCVLIDGKSSDSTIQLLCF